MEITNDECKLILVALDYLIWDDDSRDDDPQVIAAQALKAKLESKVQR